MVPDEMKQKSSLFIKQWVPENCPCTICKNYLPNIGFIYLTLLLFNHLFLTLHFFLTSERS